MAADNDRSGSQSPLRIFLLVQRGSKHWDAAWNDTNAVVQMTVQQLIDTAVIARLLSPATFATATVAAAASTTPAHSDTVTAAGTAAASTPLTPSPARLLVKHRWGLCIQIVFDLFRTAYDASLGHQP